MYLRTFLVVASIFAFVSQSLASLGTNMGVSSSGNSQTCSPAEACSTDKTTKLLSVKDLLVQPPDIIVSLLGGIYEHSPWVAENFVQQQKHSKEEITTVTELATHLQTIVDGSSREVKLTLLQSHPDLCEKVEKMKELTVESQQEQSRAGLQSMERDELQKFKDITKPNLDFPLSWQYGMPVSILYSVPWRDGRHIRWNKNLLPPWNKYTKLLGCDSWPTSTRMMLRAF
jgi:2-oxo-4-hydroxy-4-carboxy--5-ureidoimidazoline (OHCU) decarboxylase